VSIEGTGAGGAGLARRFGARCIDVVILAVPGFAAGALMDFSLVWLAIQALAVYAYFVVLDTVWGTTAGKRALGLGLAGPGSGRVPLSAALAREAFVLAGAVPFVGPLLALGAWSTIAVTAQRDPEGRGWHDRLAGGTRVTAAG
jgi:uncharacterized RDD family membrane protein YckC